MKNFSLITIIDFIFKFTLIFFINIIWTTYFIKPPYLALIVSFLTTLIIIYVFNKLYNKKKIKSNKLKSQNSHIEDVKNTFIYMSKNDQINFFYKLTSTKHNTIIKSNFIVIEKSNTVLYPYFKNEKLSEDKLIEIYNEIITESKLNCNKMLTQTYVNINNIAYKKSNSTNKFAFLKKKYSTILKCKKLNLKFTTEKLKTIKVFHIKKIIIVTNKFDTNLQNIIDNLKIQTIVLDYKQTYTLLLKEYEFYPEITIIKPQKAKTTFKQILKTALNKNKTKNYLLSALFIFFASFFVSYRIYYLIITTLLIILALLSRFEFSFNKTQKTKLIDN